MYLQIFPIWLVRFSPTYIPAFSSFTIPFSYIYIERINTIARVIFELSNRLIFSLFLSSEKLQIFLKNRSNSQILFPIAFPRKIISSVKNVRSRKGREPSKRFFHERYVSNTWPINDPPVATPGR